MRRLRSNAERAVGAGLWLVAIMFSASRLWAAEVSYFVNVQPIQICPPGQDCAPIAEPGDNQIGFIDAGGNNITRAILNQAGIDPNFLPLQQIRNGSPDITQPPNTLQLFPGLVPTQVSSPDFKALSDQDAISNGQPPSPVPPLASDPHTVNLFFVPFLNPNGNLAGSTYFGVGWIGNNGAVVDQAIFGIKSPFFGIVGAVPDAIAHETVHVLGLDHPTDNSPQAINNLMSAVRNEPSIDGALSALGSATADQLNTDQIANIINPGGGPRNPFLIPYGGVSNSVTPPATISGTFSNSAAPTLAGANLCLGTEPSCQRTLTDDFSVLFQSPGRPGESLISLTLTAPAGARLIPSLFSQLELTGDTPGITVSLLDPSCTTSCTLIFSGNPFVYGDRLDYTIGTCVVQVETCVAESAIRDLAGGRYGYLFSDGYMTTSILELVNGALTASSRHPDLTTPTNLDLSRFTPFSTSLPCAMRAGDTGCPPLVLPADDTIENLIFFQAPEPPPVTIILIGLGLLLGFELYRRQVREARVILRRYRLTPLFHSIPALRSPSRK